MLRLSFLPGRCLAVCLAYAHKHFRCTAANELTLQKNRCKSTNSIESASSSICERLKDSLLDVDRHGIYQTDVNELSLECIIAQYGNRRPFGNSAVSASRRLNAWLCNLTRSAFACISRTSRYVLHCNRQCNVIAPLHSAEWCVIISLVGIKNTINMQLLRADKKQPEQGVFELWP